MMNHKGQTLVAFLLFIPMLLIMLACIIDISYIEKEKIKLENVTKMILQTTYKDENEPVDFEQVKKLYEKNHIASDNLQVNASSNGMTIKNKYSVKSIFGSVVGLKNYPIQVNMQAQYRNGQLYINKE